MNLATELILQFANTVDQEYSKGDFMSYYNELRKLAKDNGIETPRNPTSKVLEDLLEEGGIDFNEIKDSYKKDYDEILEAEEVDSKVDRGLRDRFKEIAEIYHDASRKITVEVAPGKFKKRIDPAKKNKAIKIIRNYEQAVKDSGDISLWIKLLKFELQRRIISVKDEYFLHKYLSDKAPLSCEMIQKIGAGGVDSHFTPGEEYKCEKTFDTQRDSFWFKVYGKRTVTDMEQLTSMVARRLDRGHAVEDHEYEKDYVQYRMYEFNENEFNKYFREI